MCIVLKTNWTLLLFSLSSFLSQGRNLNLGFNTSDIIVKIGKGFCNVTSIDKHGNQLNCKPPTEQPASAHGHKYPEIIVSIYWLLLEVPCHGMLVLYILWYGIIKQVYEKH